jgi:hypothetical protein
MLSVAKKEWQELVEVIENELGKISECLHQIYHKLLKVCEPDSDDDIEVISGASGIKFSFDDKIKFIRDGYPILKLCRIFFSKLSQITSNQQLIFVEPSMQMEPDRLNKLRKSTSETWMFIYKYSHALVYPPLHPRAPVVAYALINLRGGMINCYSEVEGYWGSLLERNQSEGNRELIEDGRLWLTSWISAFLLTTETAMESAGRSFSSARHP